MTALLFSHWCVTRPSPQFSLTQSRETANPSGTTLLRSCRTIQAANQQLPTPATDTK
ncbi:hypothetical protein MtrunA17_Chr1g0190701 [Medicago truncatula]|uniref:Uncharacterized protein n=1 Tax=Medicago truncatula TaxID=3880 RepID=A0A396JT01_MEDTR|nr:hypothetical protein MtrunA17_Chr1g0190701 [Medicago truncatula]